VIDLGALRIRLADADLRPVGLRRIVTGRDALDALPSIVDFLAASGTIGLLVDATPMQRRGADLKAAVQSLLTRTGRVVQTVVAGPPDGQVHADEATVAAACAALSFPGGPAILVTVGSGTLADIGKTVGLPHVIVQTAASVNGYADDQSVLLRDGVKRTVPSHWPDALVLDEDILLEAPAAMNRAGLGDLLSMFTAPADWYLASAVHQDDSFSRTAVAIAREHGDELLDAAGHVVRLAELLAVSGISMGAAGRTAPSSGMEHTISHLLDMASNSQHTPDGRKALNGHSASDGRNASSSHSASDGRNALHGAQVGVATVIAALTWRHVRRRIAEDGLRLMFPDAEPMRRRVQAAFDPIDSSGAMSRECMADYDAKLARWHSHKDQLAGLAAAWPDHLAVLDSLLVDPVRLVEALRKVGAPLRFSQLDPPVDPETARWAVANCHLMRDRFTVADLACFLGAWTDADVDAVLAEASTMDAGL
jgi:glycerol-1-phosphate dehydrogenase [NAD(P)+]